MKKPRLALLLAFAFLVAVRIIFADHDNLYTIVAMINLVALYIVVFDIAERIKDTIIMKIADTCGSQSIANREIRKFSKLFYIAVIIINLLFIVLYFIFLCSSTANDVLAIIALGLSVLDEESVAVGSMLYKV